MGPVSLSFQWKGDVTVIDPKTEFEPPHQRSMVATALQALTVGTPQATPSPIECQGGDLLHGELIIKNNTGEQVAVRSLLVHWLGYERIVYARRVGKSTVIEDKRHALGPRPTWKKVTNETALPTVLEPKSVTSIQFLLQIPPDLPSSCFCCFGGEAGAIVYKIRAVLETDSGAGMFNKEVYVRLVSKRNETNAKSQTTSVQSVAIPDRFFCGLFSTFSETPPSRIQFAVRVDRTVIWRGGPDVRVAVSVRNRSKQAVQAMRVALVEKHFVQEYREQTLYVAGDIKQSSVPPLPQTHLVPFESLTDKEAILLSLEAVNFEKLDNNNNPQDLYMDTIRIPTASIHGRYLWPSHESTFSLFKLTYFIRVDLYLQDSWMIQPSQEIMLHCI